MAQLLFDFNYESDRLVVVQALLVMTYLDFTGTDHGIRDSWYWMGAAISLAHSINLHRTPAASLPLRTQKLQKRIWWSCVIRDVEIGLGLGHMSRIKGWEFDVPVLEESDFELEAACIRFIPPGCVLMRDTDAQRELAQIYMAKTNLCTCISSMSTAQPELRPASLSGLGPIDLLNGSPILENESKEASWIRIRASDSQLTKWYNILRHPVSRQRSS